MVLLKFLGGLETLHLSLVVLLENDPEHCYPLLFILVWQELECVEHMYICFSLHVN